MPQDRGFSRILVRDVDKHERKSRFFEYLATPNNQYFDLTKNLFFFFSDILRIRTNNSNTNDVIENPTQLSYGPKSEDG